MKLLVMDMKDDEGCAMDIALRAQDAGHDVRYWISKPHPVGEGLIQKPKEWKPSMDWAELVVLTGNCDYPPGFEEYFTQGYPILGTNPKAAELELDRGIGQEVLKRYGVETLPYHVVSSVEEAVEHTLKAGKPFAMKPWGGTTDKSTTAVPKSVNEALYLLHRWKETGALQGQLMLQEMVQGVEMGISGYFGPGGWNEALEESFEHKKFMNDNLGGNTGEMGTVIRHVTKSKLFDLVLEPLSDYLHLCRFVGDASVNCIIDDRGDPWPLEWTIRLGWPDACIRQEVLRGDPIQWAADLLYGRDSFEVSTKTVVGVVMAHGDFPRSEGPTGDPPEDWSGFPIHGITDENHRHLHFQQVQNGRTPIVVGGRSKLVNATVTAGQYPLVVTGAAVGVKDAMAKAYEVAWKISWPSNVMFRTDIGKRLKDDLPKIQKHGFAEGMKWD